jgi:hypothetical protein
MVAAPQDDVLWGHGLQAVSNRADARGPIRSSRRATRTASSVLTAAQRQWHSTVDWVKSTTPPFK